jgi:hypothetical protein
MGVFKIIDKIFRTYTNEELLLKYSYQRQGLGSGLGTAIGQTRMLRLECLRLLNFKKLVQFTPDDYCIEQEYWLEIYPHHKPTYQLIYQYLHMHQQAKQTSIKLMSQYKYINEKIEELTQKLGKSSNLWLVNCPEQFLNFDKFAQKVKNWETMHAEAHYFPE